MVITKQSMFVLMTYNTLFLSSIDKMTKTHTHTKNEIERDRETHKHHIDASNLCTIENFLMKRHNKPFTINYLCAHCHHSVHNRFLCYSFRAFVCVRIRLRLIFGSVFNMPLMLLLLLLNLRVVINYFVDG